jgi:hypothetical protein
MNYTTNKQWIKSQKKKQEIKDTVVCMHDRIPLDAQKIKMG